MDACVLPHCDSTPLPAVWRQVLARAARYPRCCYSTYLARMYCVYVLYSFAGCIHVVMAMQQRGGIDVFCYRCLAEGYLGRLRHRGFHTTYHALHNPVGWFPVTAAHAGIYNVQVSMPS